MKNPTDLEILECIYDEYFIFYTNYDTDKNRNTKIYVPIDIDLIANKLNAEGDIVFSRLYYYLSPKHSYTSKISDPSQGVEAELPVVFFDKKFGTEYHRIHFPLMSAILAELKYEHRKYRTSTIINIISIIIAVISIGIAIVASSS